MNAVEERILDLVYSGILPYCVLVLGTYVLAWIAFRMAEKAYKRGVAEQILSTCFGSLVFIIGIWAYNSALMLLKVAAHMLWNLYKVDKDLSVMSKMLMERFPSNGNINEMPSVYISEENVVFLFWLVFLARVLWVTWSTPEKTKK